MKRKILYFIIALVIVLSGVYLIRYKFKNDINQSIPQDALAVLNVNVRHLEHHFLVDFITNPIENLNYFLSARKDTLSRFSLIYNDIKLPKNIIFYTKDSLYRDWISSEFEIKNTKHLYDFLILNKFKQKKEKDYTLFIKDNFFVVFIDFKMLVGFSENPIKTISTLHFVNFISKETFLYKQIKNSKADICFSSIKNEKIDLFFIDKKIEVLGNYNFNLLKKVQILNDSNSIASLSVSFNKDDYNFKRLIGLVNHSKFKKATSVSLDTFLNYWNGDLYFNLYKFNTKVDTIISYTYDDDFNKTESVDIQKSIIPEFKLTFGTVGNISGNLIKSKTIKVINGDSIFTPFPLIQTYVSATRSRFFIFTKDKKNQFSKKYKKAYSNIDFKKYREKTDSSIFSFNTLHLINNIYFDLDEKNKVTIATNNKRNSFVYLLKKTM